MLVKQQRPPMLQITPAESQSSTCPNTFSKELSASIEPSTMPEDGALPSASSSPTATVDFPGFGDKQEDGQNTCEVVSTQEGNERKAQEVTCSDETAQSGVAVVSASDSVDIKTDFLQPAVIDKSTSPAHLSRMGGSTSSNASSSSKLPRCTRSKAPPGLRRGKWTAEEESFCSRIIHYFKLGLLPLPEGTSLRSFLAEKLNCEPMRITKKFVGSECIGKQMYHPPEVTAEVEKMREAARQELCELEERFRQKMEQLSSKHSSKAALPQVVHSIAPLAAAPSAVPVSRSAPIPRLFDDTETSVACLQPEDSQMITPEAIRVSSKTSSPCRKRKFDGSSSNSGTSMQKRANLSPSACKKQQLPRKLSDNTPLSAIFGNYSNSAVQAKPSPSPNTAVTTATSAVPSPSVKTETLDDVKGASLLLDFIAAVNHQQTLLQCQPKAATNKSNLVKKKPTGLKRGPKTGKPGAKLVKTSNAPLPAAHLVQA